MKIKKLLPLVLLAAAAVLMLSGCDAMLDVIFPSNQIIVDVRVDRFVYNDTAISPVTVVLSGPSSANASADRGGLDSHGYAHYYFDFENLKDGNYTISATYHGYYTGAWVVGPYLVTLPDDHSSNPDSSGHSVSVLLTIN
jgi:hypothetical protein